MKQHSTCILHACIIMFQFGLNPTHIFQLTKLKYKINKYALDIPNYSILIVVLQFNFSPYYCINHQGAAKENNCREGSQHRRDFRGNRICPRTKRQ